ncbi:MAG: glycoside hydrolase family 16 protein [Asgard group archaeon]|nr:glycoside hydrolase family 16 protein [Asgard group archaeon]
MVTNKNLFGKIIVAIFSVIVIGSVITLNLLPPRTTPGPYNNPSEWNLVLFDDFIGDTLNLSHWSYNYPNGWPNDGHTHNHQAYMAEENVLIENSLLRLMGENSRHPNAPDPEWGWGKLLHYNYTAGCIHSRGKLNFTRGYIEGRFKMPASRGFWPAFWMLKDQEVGLPEVDIIEVLTHNTNNLYTTVHYGHSWSDYDSYGWLTTNLPDLSADFHTYGVEISDESLTWFFDGKSVGRVFKNEYWLERCTDLFIIINLAIGGWELEPDETTIWPAYFECDWMKIWQLKE